MNTDLQKRLEEAAENAGLKAFNSAYDNLETGEVCALCQEIAVENYRDGAEQGYKEAIAEAKEWLLQHLPTPDWYGSTEEFVADFEADMNKLWEEKK